MNKAFQSSLQQKLFLDKLVVYFFLALHFRREEDELGLAKGIEKSISFQVCLRSFFLMSVHKA